MNNTQYYDNTIPPTHPVHKVDFKSVSIGINAQGKPVKNQSDANDPNLKDLFSGQCCCNDQHDTYNFLVMGQSGAGRTEFIDCFVNYLLGVEICDQFRYSVTELDDKIDERQRR